MNKKLSQALRQFEERLIYMSGMASAHKREPWQGSPEDERQRVREAFELLRVQWDQPACDLERLQALSEQCLQLYESGRNDAGDFAVRDIDQFLSELRDRAVKRTSLR